MRTLFLYLFIRSSIHSFIHSSIHPFTNQYRSYEVPELTDPLLAQQRPSGLFYAFLRMVILDFLSNLPTTSSMPAEGDGSWGINGNVLRNAWGSYELIRADILQLNPWDDPVVTETEDGAYYVFKAENSDFYPLSYLGKSGGLVVTMTSDGLVVTAAENKEFTAAVHENGGIPTARLSAGLLFLEHLG